MTIRMKEMVMKGQKLFIPYIVAGDPSPEITIKIALALQESGADLLELGVPYSDPLADGPVIQRASLRALSNNMNLKKAINLVGRMREQGLFIPVVIFTYYNPVLQLGEDLLFELLRANEVDGLLVPDLPFEESKGMANRCKEEDISFISLVAPTSNNRVKMIAENAQGFLYCVSSLGVTGVRDQLNEEVYHFLETVKKHSKVPIAVGFGISRPEQAKVLREYCDGIIVGSALVQLIEEQFLEGNCNTEENSLFSIKTFVKSLISS